MNRGRRVAAVLAWVAMATGFFAQSLFVFYADSIPLTFVSVIALSSSATLHAASIGGWRVAIPVVTGVGVLTLIAEAVGIATGFPFGEYAYTGALGPELLGVSLLVPLAWLTVAYPAFLIARLLVGVGSWRRLVARVLLMAYALTAWDVFLDSQMVDAGNWGWANPEPSLPGTPGIPLTNYAGWFVTAVLIALVLEAAVSRAGRGRPGDPRAFGRLDTVRADLSPYLVYLWTWLTSLVGNLTFWDRPSVALAGGIAMGVVAIPLLMRLAQAGRGPMVRRLLTRSTVRDLRHHLDLIAVSGPVPDRAVVAGTHGSWWDGSIVGFVAHERGIPATLMMGSPQLDRLPFLRALGAVDERELRSLTRRVSGDNTGWAVLFPEGSLHAGRGVGTPGRGAAWAAQTSGAPLVPLAIRVRLRGGQRPEAYLRFGKALDPTTELAD
ncbi:MAG: carotenoid biosynthesis protein, partial [Mycetocola sp.]